MNSTILGSGLSKNMNNRHVVVMSHESSSILNEWISQYVNVILAMWYLISGCSWLNQILLLICLMEEKGESEEKDENQQKT